MPFGLFVHRPGYGRRRADDEMMQTVLIGRLLDRTRLVRIADALVVASVMSLPWSTSATGILNVLWLLALVPTLDMGSLRRVVATPAGGWPVAFWLLALIGLLWSVGPVREVLGGFQAYARLLVIPLLLVQFRDSTRVVWVIGGFLVSCTALLLLSFLSAAWPWLWWPVVVPGVPVKDYVVQSGEFLLCAFGLSHWAIDAWRQNRRRLAAALAVLVLLFLSNIVFVATSRASIIVFEALVFVLAFQRFGWRDAIWVIVGGAILAGIAWTSSPYLRSRVLAVPQEIERFETEREVTSSGYRIAWWQQSLEFIRDAPIIGHGTGSTREMFRRAAAKYPGMLEGITDNPHNQTLSIAIQLGFVGVAFLYAMWIAHFLLFRGAGLPIWIGAGVVVQNVASSLFNSQIFYFTPGWIYVIGVGVLGGAALADRTAPGWRRGTNAANE